MNLEKESFLKSKDLLKPWPKHANIAHGHKQRENVDSWKSKGTDIYTQHWGVTKQVNTKRQSLYSVNTSRAANNLEV